MSAVRDCLFNIFAATFHIGGRSSIHNLETRHVVQTRTDTSRSKCIKCKTYKLQGLTFVGLGEAVLVNEVTIIVNSYGVYSPSPGCCKMMYVNDIVQILRYNLNIGMTFLRQEGIAYCVQTVY